jgi:RNase P subunit RPR2
LPIITAKPLAASWMEEPEIKKKRRKKAQVVILKEQTEESPTLAELVDVLDELEKKGKFVEVQICPKCKSPKVRRVKTMSGDLWSHMGLVPAKFECQECGWRARLVLKATNKRLSVRDVEIIAEALESENQRE